MAVPHCFKSGWGFVMSDETVYYFDNNATTRVAPEVVEALLPFYTEQWGNPSSTYRFGNRVGEAVARSREQVATLLNCDEREVVFTSCGTESNNAAWNSALLSRPGKRHLVTTAVEHSANIKFGQTLEKRGVEVTWLPVDSLGELDVHLLHESIREDTALVSVMYANNETGVVFPLEEIAAICRGKGVLFHTDAVQTPGKLPLDVRALGVDYLSLSAHKLHAPKGVGVLYTRKGAPWQPYVMGGGQEHGRRGGTENVAGIVAFGQAAEMAAEGLVRDVPLIRTLRDRMEDDILKNIPGVTRNGAKDPRLPNTSNLSFERCEAEAILLLLDREGICASSGSACTTGSLAPSHVLIAMGQSPEKAIGAVRLSLSKYTTDAEVDWLTGKLPPIIEKLRGASPRPAAAEVRRA
jgi:cysteine desulfurase